VGSRTDVRRFRIEISKYEYCEAKEEHELEGFTIYVYPLVLIAAEKLRAMCQQMPSYPHVRNKRARARDLYDIHSIVTEAGVDLASRASQELIRSAFEAKEVPLSLLGRLEESREFHRPDWPSVVDSVEGDVEPYDFYFDWLLAQTERLHALWNVRATSWRSLRMDLTQMDSRSEALPSS
jgi:hypothetical protein